MKFIIGLGNPGLKYRTTKHNIGFNVVKKIAKDNDININKRFYSSLLGTGSIAGRNVTLVLPETYMNLSGKAVEKLFRNAIKKIEDIIVICDDINLKLGRIRMKKKGSSGGHKGLESIIKELSRDDFARLRVGIATEVHRGDITNYVLSPFKRHEAKNASHAISLAKEAVISWIEDGPDKTMAKFNKQKAATS